MCIRDSFFSDWQNAKHVWKNWTEPNVRPNQTCIGQKYASFAEHVRPKTQLLSGQTERSAEIHMFSSAEMGFCRSLLFLTFKLIWGSWQWSQMISHGQKHSIWQQIQVSSMFRTKVTILLLEVVLGLLQPLHPVLDLQINLILLKMLPNDSSYLKTWGLTQKSSL